MNTTNSTMTLSEFAKQYHSHRNVSPAYARSLLFDANQFEAWHKQQYDRQLTFERLSENLVDEWLESYREKGGRAETTLHCYRGNIFALCRVA